MLALVGVVVAIGVGMVFTYWRNGWDLEAAALAGDAVGPFTAILTAGALVAALWSAHLQRDSVRHQLDELHLQREELAESRAALQAQVAEQRNLLEHQRADGRSRFNAELREAYATWFEATDAWILAMSTYAHWIFEDGTNPDRKARREKRDELLGPQRRRLHAAQWRIFLSDPDEKRRGTVRLLNGPQKLDLDEAESDTWPLLQQFGQRLAKNLVFVFERLEAFEARVRNELGPDGPGRVEPQPQPPAPPEASP